MNRKGVLACAAGAVIVGAAAGALFALRDRTPILTAETLERAMALWERQAPSDYDITVLKEVDAQPPEVLRTEVRGGKPVHLRVDRNEVPVSGSYAVSGLFDTAERELEMAASREKLPGQPGHAVLKALFHQGLGAPLVLKRIAPNRQSYVIRVERIEVPGREVIWQRS